MSENKVEYGLSNVHVAKITEEAGTITYGKPFAMPGVVGLSTEPEGEKTIFYADDIQYFVATANQGYTGELEISITPNEFIKEILGQTEDINGALIESAEDVNARFALMGEVKGDNHKRRFVFYDCTASRPSKQMNTIQESKEPQTDTISITMSPRSTDSVIRASLTPNETNQAIYDTFFAEVYEKNTTLVGV